MRKVLRKWMGPTPTNCELCYAQITTVFYDAATIPGPWAIMCPSCFVRNKGQLGTGRGQKYLKRGDEFIKVIKEEV